MCYVKSVDVLEMCIMEEKKGDLPGRFDRR